MASVKFTAKFEANLGTIEAVWTTNGFPTGYDRLLSALGDTLISNLERFPRMGRPFASRPPK